MSRPNILCIAIDGWHAGYVGAYGNTHLATPGVDHWAAAGVVCDQAMATGAGGWGLGAGDAAAWSALARTLGAAGYWTAFLTDDEDVAGRFEDGGFDESLIVPYEPATQPAEGVEGTQLFRLFAALGDAISECAISDCAAEQQGPDNEPPFFILAHARGMNAAWDAPYALRREFVDEDDPDPPRDVTFAPRRFGDDVDPDELLGLRAAYAGQIAVLDACLAALDDLLAEAGLGERTLVALFGVRGFPLGEHGRFGLGDGLFHGPLHEELLHVPWIMRFPGHRHAAFRLPQLVVHADLPPTLVDACGLPMPDEVSAATPDAASLMPLVETEAGPWRDRVVHACAGEEAITTPAWRLRREGERVQLFVKPDDRWEVNDVASRCGEVAEKLVAALHETREALARGEQPPPLEDVLREGL